VWSYPAPDFEVGYESNTTCPIPHAETDCHKPCLTPVSVHIHFDSLLERARR